MKPQMKHNSKSKILFKNGGRIHLLLLSLLIIATGLLLDHWWWQIGGIMMIVVITDGIYRYSTLD